MNNKNAIEPPPQKPHHGRVVRFETQREFAFPPQDVWSCLSKTDWLNRALDLPDVNYTTEKRAEGGSWIKARAKFPFGELRWHEEPFEWREPEFYHVRRVFEHGPFAESKVGVDLQSGPDGGTRAVAYAEVLPRGVVGSLLLKCAVGPKLHRGMDKALTDAGDFLRGKSRVVFAGLPIQPVNETALQVGLEKLSNNQPAELIARLEGFLRETPDVEMSQIRPLAVARRWSEDEWKVVRLFLHAARCGLLNFRWEVLCPNCRSTRETPAASLAELKRASHCDVCQIKFDAEFDKSVELKFAVHPAVRPCEERTFCLAGPGGKPHVLWQAWLQPEEQRDCSLPSSRRAVRLQSPQVKEPFTYQAGSNSMAEISCEPPGFKVTIGPAGDQPCKTRIANPNRFPVLVNWQQLDWSEDILTAARATNWQEFRDLFAHEVISPNEQVTVGSQVIMFTDLRGSTAMYHGLGDAPAYALVRNHFSVLGEAISRHHGAVVKTIGDAVMAVFSRVDEALLAVRDGFKQLSDSTLRLKCSLHVGPCLAVNANDKLDYFGTTVNLAARMVECCHGGDLTTSDEFYQRPETTRFVQQGGYTAQALEIQHRGFDAPHRVWRIEMQR